MNKIIFDNSFFNIKDTLTCGQVFRFVTYKRGYLVFSLDKCAYVYQENTKTIIECKKEDAHYFYNYFDLNRDYSLIYNKAQSFEIDILSKASNCGKGIRILNQDAFETLLSFIISQNNNIPRIKKIIEYLCEKLGMKRRFKDFEYYAFPTAKDLSVKDLSFYTQAGLGYRAQYVLKLAKDICNKTINLDQLKELNTMDLNKRLLSIYGVGPKVANCVTLFGFHKGDSFPVDTWIDKVYKENFNGKLTNRAMISKWFVDLFKKEAGYYQQYLFHYKRSKENSIKS